MTLQQFPQITQILRALRQPSQENLAKKINNLFWYWYSYQNCVKLYCKNIVKMWVILKKLGNKSHVLNLIVPHFSQWLLTISVKSLKLRVTFWCHSLITRPAVDKQGFNQHNRWHMTSLFQLKPISQLSLDINVYFLHTIKV